MRNCRHLVWIGCCLCIASFVATWSGVLAQQLIPPRPLPVPKPAPGPVSANNGAVHLIEKSEYRQYINVARDCIKDKDWNDAVTALQMILDNKEDYYVQVRERDQQGKEMLRWTSVKYEANKLLGSMPVEGLDVYELRFGAKARNLFDEAKRKGEAELLAAAAQRYFHTKAGLEANDLLATLFLDRGQYFMAALRFERLLAVNEDWSKTGDLTFFKAALAYRRAGDVKNSEATWKKLEAKLAGKGGLKIDSETITVATLQKILDETPRIDGSYLNDWPLVRGNLTNSAQANGSAPLLDEVLWQRSSYQDQASDNPKANLIKQRLDAAMNQIQAMKGAILPGSFPIVANNLMIYRSYQDVRAVYLKDGKDRKGRPVKAGDFAWSAMDFDRSLGSILGRTGTPGRFSAEEAFNFYTQNPGFAGMVFENSLLGTLSSDHRYVYAIDDFAVPTPFTANPQLANSPDGYLGEMKNQIMENVLYAFDLQNDGRLVWRLGGHGLPVYGLKPDQFAYSHFLGAPLSIGGKLFILNEKNNGQAAAESELRLVCIDPNKVTDSCPAVVEPIQVLGTIQASHGFMQDPARRTNASLLAYGEGILVCPTNAGQVLGVDLMSRSLAWAYPYREDDSTNTSIPPGVAIRPGVGIRQPGIIFQPNQNQNGISPAHWHSAPPVISEGKVVFTAPDASSVHCINLRDGTPAWKRQQVDGDLYLAGVVSGKVLIVGKYMMRALSLDDGRPLWTVATGDLPSGQGVASRGVYYLPLQKGEILAIDIERGTVRAHNRSKTAGLALAQNEIPPTTQPIPTSPNGKLPKTTPKKGKQPPVLTKISPTAPGNLVYYEGTVLSQTAWGVAAYPQLVARLDLVRAAVKADANNPTKQVELAELLLADGQTQLAIDNLQNALAMKLDAPLSTRARNGLYDGITDLLQADFSGASRYLETYRELCDAPENPREREIRLARYYRIVGQGREAQGNLVAAFQMYRAFGALSVNRENGGIALLDDPGHVAPTSVWLRGRLSSMMARATPEQRAPLEKQIASEWQDVQQKDNEGELRAFVDMFDIPFSVGRQARLRLAQNIIRNNDRTHFLEAELDLMQLRGPEFRADPAIGGAALAGLAALEEQKGSAESMKSAAAYYRELARAFPQTTFRQGRTGLDLLNDLATDKRYLPFLEENSPSWGSGKIAAREIGVQGVVPNMVGFSFQPEGDMTPSFARMRLLLDVTGAGASNPTLRLVDATTMQTRWTQNIGNIPINGLFYNYLAQQEDNGTPHNPNARFRYFHVTGHLIVCQLGMVVLGLDSDNGATLWRFDLNDEQFPNLLVNNGIIGVQGIMPDADGYLQLLLFNQMNGSQSFLPVGHVGVVQPSHVGIITSQGLVVLDPLNGNVLWSRVDVPANTRLFGDRENLFLVDHSDAGPGTGWALRARDGENVVVPDFGFVYQNRIRIQGARILASEKNGGGQLILHLYDIPTGKDVWRKTFDDRARVLQTEDENLTGVIEPDGKIVVLDAQTGRNLCEGSAIKGRITTDEMKKVDNPFLVADADHYFVFLNKPAEPGKLVNGGVRSNFSDSLRCMPVNGWLLALHRHDSDAAAGQPGSFKAGDFHWHTLKPIENQMLVLDQLDLMPVFLFSSRFIEMTRVGLNSQARWAQNTQSIDKATGKAVYEPGIAADNLANQPQFYGFGIDMKEGTINMLGARKIIQHYVDDGRPMTTPIVRAGLPGPLNNYQIEGGIFDNGIIINNRIIRNQ